MKTKLCSVCCMVAVTCVLILYCSLQLEDILKIENLPYREDIERGIEIHRKEFKWHTSLSGDYCSNVDPTKYRENYKQYNVKHKDSLLESRKRVFLMSYPRSGNHLTRAILECLLNYPTFGYRREDYSIYLERTTTEYSAISNADAQHPYIRKWHSVQHLHESQHQFGLIFLIRDPLESILSERKTRPHFWKDYEGQMESLVDLATFYVNWNDTNTKLLLYYEDYFNISVKWINLLKIQSFFGKDIISDERMNFCIDHFENVTHMGLSALERSATGHNDLHYYRDRYYSKHSIFWPEIRVPVREYNQVFCKYEQMKCCGNT